MGDALKNGMLKFDRRDQYNDFVEEIQKDRVLVKKCIGLQTGLMVLFSGISAEKHTEVMDLAAGGTWYDDFQLSLARQE